MRTALVACFAVGYATPAVAQGGAVIQGCWRTDRPLGPTGGFRTLVLQDSGHVALPLIPASQQSMWNRRSYWSARGDSVTVRIFTGLHGWNAVLVRTSVDAMRGIATQLSDAIVVGQEPTRIPILFGRIACERLWPSTRVTRPSLRAWERDELLYSSAQVDWSAALSRTAPLPQGILAARQLGYNERATTDSTVRHGGIARVLLRLVVEKDGRAAVANAIVLSAADSTDVQQVRDALSVMRFDPATKGGKPVHQSGAWLFELRRP